MTQYKLVSKGGSTLSQSSNRQYLSNLQKSYKGSQIVKITYTQVISVRTSQAPLVRRMRIVSPRRGSISQKASAPPPIQGSINIMPSSWIRDIRYDSTTSELYINMRGKWYGPWYTDSNTYIKFLTGKAVPVTTDKVRPARWARGIGPSLGAGYHKYIKIGGAVPPMFTLEQQIAQKYKLLAQIQ